MPKTWRSLLAGAVLLALPQVTPALAARDPATGWDGWESLGRPPGGPTADVPSCTTWRISSTRHRIDCFVEAPGGGQNAGYAVWHRWWDGAAWRGWENLGGRIYGYKPECVSWGPNRIDCFILSGGDDPEFSQDLWHRWWDGTRWSTTNVPTLTPEWEHLGSGGTILSSIECLSWAPGRLDCFAYGGSMRQIWWNGTWQPWVNLHGVLTSVPDCTSWAAGRYDCFMRGTDGALWHRWWDGGTYGDWGSLGLTPQGQMQGAWADRAGRVHDGGPECVTWGPGRLDCFVNSNYSMMWQRSFQHGGGGWGKWVGHYDSAGIMGKPECVSWGPNRIDCFARGTAGVNEWQLLHRWWDGAIWRGWTKRGTVRLVSQPECVSSRPNRIDCFAEGEDGALWHISRDGVAYGG